MESLRTAEQIQLLDLVDSLRAEGLSEFTALPQLIVCGDQSSDKSFLLQAISGVPYDSRQRSSYAKLQTQKSELEFI